MKRTIRLNESELKQMIAESVRKVLYESQSVEWAMAVAKQWVKGWSWKKGALRRREIYSIIEDVDEFLKNFNDVKAEEIGKRILEYYPPNERDYGVASIIGWEIYYQIHKMTFGF